MTHFASKSDYLSKNPTKVLKDVGKVVGENGAGVVKEASEIKEVTGDKVDLSEASKDKAAAKKTGKDLKDETKKAAKHLKNDAVNTAKSSGVSSFLSGLVGGLFSSTPSLPTVKLEAKVAETKAAKEVIDKANENLKPGIFMITGFQFGGISDDDSGLPEMAKFIPGAKRFQWDQEDEVLKEISKLNKNSAIVLVGHSLGGDAVINIANKLNTLENGYRKVDLAVTLDSVGFNNDIIPRNVKENLNFIGDRDMFFNDGPNIARFSNETKVFNELRSEDHMGIDDAEDVQFKIFEGIKNVLKSHEDNLQKDNQQRGLKLFADNLNKMIENSHNL